MKKLRVIRDSLFIEESNLINDDDLQKKTNSGQDPHGQMANRDLAMTSVDRRPMGTWLRLGQWGLG